MKQKINKRQPIIDIAPRADRQPLINWSSLNYYRKQLLVGLVIVLVVLGIFLFSNHSPKTTGPSSQSLINSTVDSVSKLILLPTGEQPTLAIVNDASKYASSSFFKNTANGDRLLIYARAQEAILYRPSINKIIAVAPLNVNAATGSSSSSP